MPLVCLSQLPKSTKDLEPPTKPFWLGLKFPPCQKQTQASNNQSVQNSPQKVLPTLPSSLEPHLCIHEAPVEIPEIPQIGKENPEKTLADNLTVLKSHHQI